MTYPNASSLVYRTDAPFYQISVDPGLPVLLSGGSLVSEPTAFLSVLRGSSLPPRRTVGFYDFSEEETWNPTVTPSSPVVVEDNGALSSALTESYQAQPSLRPDGANAIVWENVPTQRGITFHSLDLPRPVLKSALDASLQAIDLPASSEFQAGMGMFLDRAGNPLLPSDVQARIDNDAFSDLQWSPRPGAISFAEGGQLYVARLCFYLVLDADLELQGAVPPITAMFSSQGQFVQAVDSRGVALQGTLQGLPLLAPLLTLLKWGVLATLLVWILDSVLSPILRYFGLLPKETKIGTTALQWARKTAGTAASVVYQNVIKPVAGFAAGAGAFWLLGLAAVGYLASQTKRAASQAIGGSS